MSLVLTIIKFPANMTLTESAKTFDEQGGTLGRGDNNTWVLPDPERFLSATHCQISFENGQFFLTDSSTNGTFINGLPQPVGRGNRRALQDGDVFDLGDYGFQVSLTGAGVDSGAGSGPAQEFEPSVSDQVSLDDPFNNPPQALFDAPAETLNSPFADPFAANGISESPLVPDPLHETDPLLALDKVHQAPQSAAGSDVFSNANPAGGVLNDSLHWPTVQPEGGAIPDDWDEDLDLSPAPPAHELSLPMANSASGAAAIPADPVQASVASAGSPRIEPEIQKYVERNSLLEDANQQLRAEIRVLKRQLEEAQASSSAGVTSEQVDRSFVNALGFSHKDLEDHQVAEISQVAGELVRETVIGMMQVLSSRSSIKNEFRMNVTTIQPVENNPLKFSANVEDALENMFIKQGNAFKKPVDAVKEGFQSIAEHQIAILAGMRSAFKGVMDRFDPLTLEKRFEKQSKGGLIGRQKAKNWSAYFEYYNELANDIDKSFQYLFGDDFVQAYEDQLRKLSISHKEQAKHSQTKDL